VSAFDQFLEAFQTAPEMSYLKSLAREEFFPKLFHLANGFTDNCCQKLVKIIRASSVVPGVSEAPAPLLARRVRETAFHGLDPILGSYVATAKKIAVTYGNIQKIRQELERVAMGTPPDELQKADSEPKSDGAGQEQKWATDDELARQHETLLKLQMQAFTRVIEYLKGLEELPRRLMSYACEKCFGADVNFTIEEEQVVNIQAEIRPKLRKAVEGFSSIVSSAKEHVEEERRTILTNIEMRKTDIMLAQVWEEKLEAKEQQREKWRKITTKMLLWLIVFALVAGAGVAAFIVMNSHRK
jgi:hypothetical protein